MNTYEISTGIGVPFKYHHANNEEEVVEYMKIHHPDYIRYRDMTDEEKKENLEKFQYKNCYHVHLLHPDVLARRIKNYRNDKDYFIVELDRTQKFLNQLLQEEK